VSHESDYANDGHDVLGEFFIETDFFSPKTDLDLSNLNRAQQ